MYNLEDDLAETRNVALENPRVVRQMKALAKKTAGELGDGERMGSGVRKAGYVDKAMPMNR